MIRKARGRLDGQVHGAAPAPYKALDLIEGALSGWSLEEGYAAEEEAVGELLPGRQAQASLYAFDLVDRRAKSAPGRPSVRAAPDPQGRPRRRRPDGGAARDALPAPARGAGRDARPQRGGARQRPHDDRGRPRRAGRQGPLRRGQGALPRLARLDLDELRRLRRLRPRARGGLRGARGQAAGLRRAARAHAARLRARDQHLEPLGRGDGRRRRHPLLQPGRRAPARRARPHAGHRRRDARHRLGLRRGPAQAAGARRRRAGVRRQPRADAPDERRARRARARHRPRRGGRGDPRARPADGSVGAAADGRPARRQPRARDAARRLPRPLPALADARELRRGQRRDRRPRAGAARSRGAARDRARGARRRDPPPAAGGRRRGGEGRRHGAAARRRLAVLARRDHQVPRPGRHFGEDVRRSETFA